MNPSWRRKKFPLPELPKEGREQLAKSFRLAFSEVPIQGFCTDIKVWDLPAENKD